jgi:signal transduction histidine kinase
VIDNLLANIRAHTPEGAPATVTLSAEDNTAVLTVSDTGLGLEPEQLTSVFTRFYRADASRTRASGGAGLGLSIVAAVVEAHGGTVTATSEPGQGTTITVRLPLPSSS